jgi:peptidoglycan/xylan/chitin deacetylase (PgdA/CDA1 family)
VRVERPAAEPAKSFTAYVWDDSDSLEKLSAMCSMTPSQLLAVNNLKRSELRDGQVLRLPGVNGADQQGINAERQRAREIWRGIRGDKRVALTFDAGGEDDAANDLLKYLLSARAPATFFATGQFVADHAKLLKQIAEAGYPVHNHSWSHPEFTKIENDKIAEELERTDWAIRDVTGSSTKPYWRPPFGDRDNRVLRAAAEVGYQSIYWTLDSLDSVGDKKSPEFIVSRILNPPNSAGDPDRYLDGAIILMHVGEPGTAAAVPLLIRSLRERGFQLVTVDEIVRGGTASPAEH